MKIVVLVFLSCLSFYSCQPPKAEPQNIEPQKMVTKEEANKIILAAFEKYYQSKNLLSFTHSG